MLSVTLHAWQYYAGRGFQFRRPADLREPVPAVSILKPIGSLDEIAAECLTSWLEQDYPGEIEILFGIDVPNAAAQKAIEDLLASRAKVTGRLILCPPSTAANPKVAKLIELVKQARHDCLVVSDADVHVEPDFLRRYIAEFTQSKAELATCLYRLRNGATFAQNLECAANNIDFWSQVVQARSIGPIDFALGAAMAVSRESLQKIGGFEALADYIADDYQLGNRLSKQGAEILIASTPVDCRHSSATARDILRRQIRWARTMRICKPMPYFFSVLSNPTLWPLLYYLLAPADPVHAASFLGCALLRVLLAKDLARRFLETNNTQGIEWLTPIRDLIHALVWTAAFMGNRVVWAGRGYRLARAGTMKLERVS